MRFFVSMEAKPIECGASGRTRSSPPTSSAALFTAAGGRPVSVSDVTNLNRFLCWEDLPSPCEKACGQKKGLG